MVHFYVFILFCFVSGAFNENLNRFNIEITKNKIIWPKKQLTISSKEVTVEIYVYKVFPVNSHDDITLDLLTCYDSKSNNKIFSNLNFFYETDNLNFTDTQNTQYIYKITQELKIQRGNNGEWQWLCKLYVHWDGCNEIFECEVNVEMKDKNETNESTSKDEEEKPESEPVELKAFSRRNRIERTTEPKPRHQKCKNQKSTETHDGMARGVEASNTSKNINDSSKQVVYGEISTTIWVIFIVASVVIFIVGLVIGVICRLPSTPASAPPEPAEQTDDLTDDHVYEEMNFERAPDRNVVDKGFENNPALPVPEKAANIYNIPYDHTPWFKNIGRKKRLQINEKKKLVPVET